MADFFQDSPTFINPSYVTPEQRKAQIAYADALMKRAGEGVTRPTGALGAMIDQLTSNIYRNATMNQEQQSLARDNRNAEETAAATAGYAPALMAGGGAVASGNPTAGGGIPAALMNTPANVDKAIVTQTNYDGSPRVLSMNGSVPDQPNAPYQVASLGPAGGGASPPPGAPAPSPSPVAGGAAAPTFNQRFAQAFPNGPQYNPRTMADMLTSQTASPEIRALASGIVTPKPALSPTGQPIIESLIGGQHRMPVQGGIATGLQQPITVAPGGAVSMPVFTPAEGSRGASGVTGQLNAIKPALDFSREQGVLSNVTAKDAEGISAMIERDKSAAQQAYTVKKNMAYVTDTIQKYAPFMTFGPFGEVALQGRQALVNAGFGGKQLAEATAAAESINKIANQTAGMLAQQLGGGTQGEWFNNLKNVPGLGNSAQGAVNMAKLFSDMADTQTNLLQLQDKLRKEGRLAEYPSARQQFLDGHPVVNPATGNDITKDIEAAKAQQPTGGGGGFKVLKVH